MYCYSHFYRAVVCLARTMLSQDVCPSACLSVTRRYCAETAKHNLKLFQPRHTKRYGNILTGTLPPTGASNGSGYEKNRDFRRIFALSRK